MRHRCLAVIVAGVLVAVVAAQAVSQGRLRLVATTALMGCALRDVGGERVAVTVLMPPGSCPGHFDMRPEDAKSVTRGVALFAHGYEPFVPRLMKSDSAPRARVRQIAESGNWLVPSVYARAAGLVSQDLAKLDPAHRTDYSRRLAALQRRTRSVNREMEVLLKRQAVVGAPVLCSEQLAPLLRWMGLSVAATYGRPEDITPRVLHQLLDTGRQSRVRLVVDNLQSGPNSGAQLAQELGVRRVVLSNFPGGFAKTATWELCLKENVRRITGALSRRPAASQRHE